jgi:hypothetical protein
LRRLHGGAHGGRGLGDGVAAEIDGSHGRKLKNTYCALVSLRATNTRSLIISLSPVEVSDQ